MPFLTERSHLLQSSVTRHGSIQPSSDESTFSTVDLHSNSDKGETRGNGSQEPGQSHTHLHDTTAASFSGLVSRIDAFFQMNERKSCIEQELRAGAVSFVTMAYILIVNAQILSQSGPDSSGEYMQFDSIVIATALSSAIGSALVGLFGNLPFGLAPGMGLNSYFTYGVCLKLGISWRVALTSCFFQGFMFLALALVGACEWIQVHAPPCIKKSITVGLGLFQALIGFEFMRFIVPGRETLLSIGDMSDSKIYLALAGMLLIGMLLIWKMKAAMIIGITIISIFAWILDLSPLPLSIMEMPPGLQHPFALLDVQGFWLQLHVTLPVTLVMLFVSILDTAGVQYICGTEAELIDPETQTLPGAKAAFCSAGVATAIGAMLGTGPVIIHNETIAGISDGARTGLHSVTVAVLFLLSIPFLPLLRSVPPIAAAAPLVIVGMYMMMATKYIDWDTPHEALPAFLCATIIPYSYSIANGMMVGIVAYVVLKATHRCGELLAPHRFQSPPVPLLRHACTCKCCCSFCEKTTFSRIARNEPVEGANSEVSLHKH